MPSRNIVKQYDANAFYHVYNRGLNKQRIFKDDQDYSVFLNLLKRYLNDTPILDKKGRQYEWLYPELELLAYCLMPNHFHLLLFQVETDSMTKFIRGVATAYTGYFNKKYNRVGPLFQGVFKASHVTREDYLQHISRYIHMNPDDYQAWEYSSLPCYLGKKNVPWVRPDRITSMFEQDSYKDFLHDYEDYRASLKELAGELADDVASFQGPTLETAWKREAIVSKTVYVGLSGGVDSSVTAALLKQKGYNVVGVYMKNWSKDLPGMPCPWKDDYQDAKRVAVQLGIDFKMYDFQAEYQQKVVDYMIAEYQAGRTPNPDIMCNQEVKFRLFLDTALADGADLIATGHYARIKDGQLLIAANADKDQTYFLYRVTEDALHKSLMPIGDFSTKAEVREMAKKLGLATAQKKDSQGICFVGKVGIRDFLSQYVTTEPGAIKDQHGVTIGHHDGAIFYTIGQRHGLHVGGGLPYYVTGKDMAKNEVYVTTNLDDENLWKNELQLADAHWINDQPQADKKYQVRTRYRAPLVGCTVQQTDQGAKLILDEQVRAITPGQSAVVYDGYRVVGGGIVV